LSEKKKLDKIVVIKDRGSGSRVEVVSANMPVVVEEKKGRS